MRIIKLQFEELKDYLACVKAMNDAEIASLNKVEEMRLTLRRALSTAIPRHSDPSGPQTACDIHRGESCDASIGCLAYSFYRHTSER